MYHAPLMYTVLSQIMQVHPNSPTVYVVARLLATFLGQLFCPKEETEWPKPKLFMLLYIGEGRVAVYEQVAQLSQRDRVTHELLRFPKLRSGIFEPPFLATV